jgi:hypothetical protein
MVAMPMRTDCKHYDSRTYASGEVVQKCRLDLAPEAPWRCPDNCPAYVQRRMDAGWNYGSLERSSVKQPEPAGDDIAALLDEAEDIVNTAAPGIIEDFDKKRGKRGRFRRKKK